MVVELVRRDEVLRRPLPVPVSPRRITCLPTISGWIHKNYSEWRKKLGYHSIDKIQRDSVWFINILFQFYQMTYDMVSWR